MQKTIPLLALLLVLGANAANAEDINAELQQLQTDLAANPDDDRLLNDMGVALHKAGKYAEAEPLYLRSLEILEKKWGNEHVEVATRLNNLAELYNAQGKYEQAEPLFLRALAIDEKLLGKDHLSVALYLNNLGMLYKYQGKYQQAESLLLRSLAIREQTLIHDHPDVAYNLNNLALLYSDQGKYEKAFYLYQKSLEIWEKNLGKDDPLVATSLNNLALLGDNLGKYEQAESLYLRSLDIREQALGYEHPTVAESVNNLAQLYQHQGKYDQAAALNKRSLGILEKTLGKDAPYVALSLENLALLYCAKNEYEQAAPLLHRSLRIMNQLLNRWLWGAGEKTRQSYLQKQETNRNIYLNFYTERNIPEEAFYFSLSRKGLLLRVSSEISALAKQSSDPVIQQQTQEFNALKAQLSSLALSGKADKTEVQTLEEKINTLEMQLSQKVAGFKRSKTEVSPAQVLEKLKSEQVVVDFLVYTVVDLKTVKYKTEQVMALIADKQNGIKLIKLGALATISEAIKTYRQNVVPTATGQLANREAILKPASQKLYQLLWQPLLPYLANKTEVYLIPDGILHLLPFKALRDKQGHYLAESKQITLLTSARDIVLPPLTGKTSDSAIFAAPAFGDKNDKTNHQPTRSIATRQQDIYFAPLEGAEAEGQAISDLIKSKQAVQFFQSKQATESNVAGLKSPRLLHFATHGFFLENIKPVGTQNFASLPSSSSLPVGNIENPLTRSGLAFAGANLGIKGKKQADGTDGILTALEVLALNLEGTDLVTLSACETGVGDIQVGEGVYSLNRAFQEAGAKSVLSTLWGVADEQTKLFMQEFYTLVLNGDSPQQALQKTQLKFISDKNTQDPFFWAAFTVVGI